ncbi:hypothetical protein JAAARDRAFT_197114 [Jaapia argillacea MUCL 33604]|uniref:Uncharacterized protein n=1 Tax=Jaapia argillacea MUCL 33604 TaxID=933084 RepID=A0A067PQR4_9AGAM|nr:hypothetical protein JAAARDRAFT_197114 [Jaapia argillacea MUCL 33604]
MARFSKTYTTQFNDFLHAVEELRNEPFWRIWRHKMFKEGVAHGGGVTEVSHVPVIGSVSLSKQAEEMRRLGAALGDFVVEGEEFTGVSQGVEH